MADLIVPEGTPDIVNLKEARNCCFCGNYFRKREQMWKYPDGNYMCIKCKTQFDDEEAKGVTYSDGQQRVRK